MSVAFNPDLSEVKITLTEKEVHKTSWGFEVELNGEDLLEFAADYVRGKNW